MVMVVRRERGEDPPFIKTITHFLISASAGKNLYGATAKDGIRAAQMRQLRKGLGYQDF